MKPVFLRGLMGFSLILPMTFGHNSALAQNQEKLQSAKAIDLDKELQGETPRDVGRSYYHFALAKWNEAQEDLGKAISEMREALRYNENSAAVRVELAALLQNVGDTQSALQAAEEAVRLDPRNTDAHWLLANIYSRTSGRGAAGREGLDKTVKELETLRDIDPADERAYYALGGAYFDLEEPEKAIQAFEKFQQLNSGSNAGYREIAKYYEKTGNEDKAIEYLQKATNTVPEDWESLLKLATLYSKASKNEEAIPIYRKILELVGEDNAAVRRQLALSMVEAGQNDEAIKLLEEMVASTPNDAILQVLYGRALIGNNELPKAIETLKSVQKENPDNMEANFYLGSAYERSNRFPEAIAVFTELLEKSDSDSDEYKANRMVFQQHLAADYQEMGETAKAVAVYEEMVKRDPNPRLYYMLLNAYRVNRQFDKAIALGKEQFQKSPDNIGIGIEYARALADASRIQEGIDVLNSMLLKDPGNVDIYVHLSQIYLQSKQYADAERVLRLAEGKKLDNERLKFQLATIYERQKEFDRAESLLEQILRENPRNASALNYIGYMLADRGIRLQEAVKYVEEALEIDPNNGAYLDSLGWAFFKLNDLKKAEKYLTQAADLIKNDPVIHDHLGDLYYKAGDLNKARDSWQKSLNHGGEPEDAQKVRQKLDKLRETLRKQNR